MNGLLYSVLKGDWVGRHEGQFTICSTGTSPGTTFIQVYTCVF